MSVTYEVVSCVKWAKIHKMLSFTLGIASTTAVIGCGVLIVSRVQVFSELFNCNLLVKEPMSGHSYLMVICPVLSMVNLETYILHEILSQLGVM